MNIDIRETCGAVGRDAWDGLVSQSATNTIFQTYDWHRAFEKSYGADHTGYILCGTEDGELAGIAPFCVCKSRGEKVIRFLGYGRADYCDLIYPAGTREFVAEVLSFLNDRRSAWDRVELYNIPEVSLTNRLVSDAVARHRLISFRGEKTPCPALLFKDKDRSYKEMIRKKSLVRHHNYFLKKKDFRVSHFVRCEDIDMRLSRFFDQHVARWSVTAFPSLFLNPRHREFYRHLAGEFDGSGKLLFTELSVGAHPVAYHFGFVHNGALIWYKPSFDIQLSRNSPGEALLKELMVFVERNNLDELDFTIGDEAFKSRYSNVVRFNSNAVIFNRKSKLIAFIARKLTKDLIGRLPEGLKKRVLSVVKTRAGTA